MAQMPSVRVNRQGQIDPTSTEADAKAGAFELEKRLHLFRNFEHLHWVPVIPSQRDPATGAWRGGDLDGAGDGRGLGIAGNCIFVGHANGAGVRRAINILKIQPDPAKQPPVIVGEIPAMVEGNQGFDDRELRSLIYKTSRGEDRYLLVRNAGTNTLGRMETFRIDMNTCLPAMKSEVTDFYSQSHEFFLWHDPANTNRVLVYMTNWTGGVPDPTSPGLKVPDLIVLAVTDEETGEVLTKPRLLAGFTLQEVGGPPIDERPDATGLFSDGRFLDFSDSKNALGQAGNFQNREQNRLHSVSVTDDGERVYVAGTTAGFYVIDSEAVARGRNAQLAAGQAGCNQRSTIVLANGVIDAAKLPLIANDCLHMVVNNDPGLKAFLASNASPEAKAARYLVLLTRSRFDVYPPVNASPTGTHSAVFVPESAGARPWQYERTSSVRVVERRERRMPAQLRADGLGRIRDDTDHGRRVCDPRQPGRGVPHASDDRAERSTASPHSAAESQSDDLQEPGLHHVVRPRSARDRHFQPVHTARGRPCVDRAAGSRPHLSDLQGWPDLLGGQRHGSSRGALHRAPCERTAWPRHRNI